MITLLDIDYKQSDSDNLEFFYDKMNLYFLRFSALYTFNNNFNKYIQ